MKDKALKKLSRGELLEILLERTKELEAAEEEIASLRAQLEDKRIKIETSGSIAEASLKLGGVMEAAEKSAALYIANAELVLCEAEAESKRIIEEAKAEAERIINDAKE